LRDVCVKAEDCAGFVIDHRPCGRFEDQPGQCVKWDPDYALVFIRVTVQLLSSSHHRKRRPGTHAPQKRIDVEPVRLEQPVQRNARDFQLSRRIGDISAMAQ
jgi:hypothetical protein